MILLINVDVLAGLITSFIIMFLITLIVSLIVFSLIKLLSVKVKFYIRDDKNQEWEIKRRVDKTKLLVSRDSNIYKFIYAKSILKTELIRKLDKDNLNKIWFYDKIIKYTKFISITLIILIIALLILNLSLDKDTENKIRILSAISLLIANCIFSCIIYCYCICQSENHGKICCS